MVGVRISIDGRLGIMIADPGYHVGRIVTVMTDRLYPHTGWFTQVPEPDNKKEYVYFYNIDNINYIEWHEKQTKGEKIKKITSLIYAAQPYLSAINVTERRNLVYNFRSMISRDLKGRLAAGIYFPVNKPGLDTKFTMFFHHEGKHRKAKYKFSSILDHKNNQELLDEVNICNVSMNNEDGYLQRALTRIARMLCDSSFVRQMLEINDAITN
ncbi:unnamed protein product [Leptidea sinapis]|uniref:Uncharacterized protein n=2 Tax=Leptidea sinapis TaxID=189913 RepID=A0A5E4PR44_9NEOP|nr:unnamed protein product [Leptidea sinapis]